MKKTIMFLTVVLSVVFVVQGQLIWARRYGGLYDDRNTKVLELNDGNIILGGSSDGNGDGSYDHLYFFKIDTDGDTIWTRKYETEIETDSLEELIKIINTSDGNVLIYLDKYKAGNFNTDLKKIIKIDGEGEILWNNFTKSRTTGDIIELDSGNYFTSWNNGDSAGCTALLDSSNGDTLWTRYYIVGWIDNIIELENGGFF